MEKNKIISKKIEILVFLDIVIFFYFRLLKANLQFDSKKIA